ncbi:MAG: acyl-CoA dehydrogenase family protein [Pirellulaceae bacterium]|nr:acyl-CoA dehydrogenase family protein [Pirellulaceae bacterium]
MTPSALESSFTTHQVTNQSPVFGGHNAYADDPLIRHLTSDLSTAVRQQLDAHGQWAGQHDTLELARLANRHLPQLKSFDTKGHRIDQVEFHPAWHELMRCSIQQGMHCSVWQDTPAEVGQRHLARATRYYLTAGVEMGHLCPITMTNACVAALNESPEIAQQWLPQITCRHYDPSNRPASTKQQVILGMGMTEKQGGTDVRANTTRAEPTSDGWWRIVGHKWFMSVPQSDAFLILGQTADGLSCFLLPRLLPDGSDNGLRFQRLKDKLGNRSNASSEVEFHGSLSQLVGQPGKGVQTIIEMVTLTRLDCAVATAGLLRASLWEAVEHCRHREVLGKRLIAQPLMRRVLADMALDLAAATALALRLARAYDRATHDAAAANFSRLMTPVIKYWTCKIAPGLVYEAMECLGGNGYVEEGNLARHYREAPLNAIWEGSGNVMCLDVIRVLSKDRDAIEEVLVELQNHLDTQQQADALNPVRTAAKLVADDPGGCRVLTERLALAAAAAEFNRVGLPELAQAFIDSRLCGPWRSTYGMIDGCFEDAILSATFI